MANKPVPQSSSSITSRISAGPKLIGVGAALFALIQIIKFLPLGLIDGPIVALLWVGVILTVLAGAGLMLFKAKRS